MLYAKTLCLFTVTALAEIIGCYLPYQYFKHDKPLWVLLGGIASLSLFVWLLTLHPEASGRVYATYGGVYIAVAMLWLKFVDNSQLSMYDYLGAFVCLIGISIIIMGWNTAP